MRYRQEQGFTIVELMIATVVFSVILLMTLGGFLQIGRTFYKGMTISRTENTIRSIADSLSIDIRASQVAVATTTKTSASDNRILYFCIGNHVYYFMRGVIFDNDPINNPKNDFGLRRGDVTSACADPISPGNSPTNIQELLGQKMRVSKLNVTCSSIAINRLCELDIHIAYGDNQLLDNPQADNALCKGATAGTQFCATADINTSILRGGSS
ncbi:prepilin-type N-terminal cleavage/methylation domain-containing protein [Candidatus Saccharibacteria bacterium]|nr:prepilin-type N-terminal cleavage/methylation domain-containing protein [Candidatus Saccharibacteria bacterium]